MPAGYRLRMLGGLALEDGVGRAVALPTRKARLLLAYLATPAGVFHSREKLAGLLWPDRGEEQARASLRNALAALRAALCPEAVLSGAEGVALRPGSVETELDALRAGALPEGLGREFLEGFDLAGEALSDWLGFERHRCRSLAQEALEREMERAAGAAAIALGHRLVALDPLRERSHRRLVEACLRAGERSLAAVQLQACREVLQRELGVAPSPETEALAARVSESPRASQPPSPAVHDARFAVAVLPFAHGEEDAFLAEGFAEDLVTELSTRPDFLVIARQSARLFSGQPDAAPAAAAEVGARYALVGSLRRSGTTLRVTAQLLDTMGQRCVWAGRHDRPVDDIFAVQDELVERILAAVDAGVRDAERERAARVPPRDLDAWALFHRGLWHAYRFTPEDVDVAEAAFRDALARVPDFGLGHAGLAYADFVRAIWFFAPDPAQAVARGLPQGERAVRLDPGSAFCRTVFGRLLTLAGAFPEALEHLSRALETNPSFAQAHFGMAQALVYAGRDHEALSHAERALLLSPKDPLASMVWTLRAFCHLNLGQAPEAERAARSAAALRPTEAWSRLALAVALMAQARQEEAQQAVAEACRLRPGLTLGAFAELLRHARPENRDRVLRAVEAAGLPG